MQWKTAELHEAAGVVAAVSAEDSEAADSEVDSGEDSEDEADSEAVEAVAVLHEAAVAGGDLPAAVAAVLTSRVPAKAQHKKRRR